VIARAENGLFVDGSGATCAELRGIIEVDRTALDDEKRKLARMSGKANPELVKTVEASVQALTEQVERLEGLQAAKAAKGCNDEFARLGTKAPKTILAKAANPTQDKVNALYSSILSQVEKVQFGELDWGDAEAKVLSQALKEAKELKKLDLNNNRIQDDGVKVLAASIKDGAAPKLKKIVLANNPGISAEAKQALLDAREGLQIL
jgi:hypothetical protein